MRLSIEELSELTRCVGPSFAKTNAFLAIYFKRRDHPTDIIRLPTKQSAQKHLMILSTALLVN